MCTAVQPYLYARECRERYGLIQFTAKPSQSRPHTARKGGRRKRELPLTLLPTAATDAAKGTAIAMGAALDATMGKCGFP